VKVQQLSVKLFAEDPIGFDQSVLIPIFHDWIRRRRLEDRLLIDVADYRHVADGPGVMLVAHEAHYGLDQGGGRLGLLCSRKRDEPGDASARLLDAVRDALRAGHYLEREPTFPLRFRGGELEIRVQSRLLAPNRPETLVELRPELDAFLARLYPGADVQTDHLDEPRQAFGVRVRTPENPSLAELLGRVQ
jgi:hypothetical protein